MMGRTPAPREAEFPSLAAEFRPRPPIMRGKVITGPTNTSDLILPVTGPSLILWQGFQGGAGISDCIQVSCDSNQGAGDVNAALPSIGPYTYLPRAGTYRIHNISNNGTWTGGTPIVGLIQEDIDPILALALMTTPLPNSLDGKGTRTIVIGVGAMVFLNQNATCFHFHGMLVSNTGANPCNIAFGNPATVAVGHPLAAGAEKVIPSNLFVGCGVTAFSAAGTTLQVTASTR